MRKTASFLIFLSLFLTACASKTVPPGKDAASYFQEAEAYFADGEYKDAIAAWEKVRESYQSAELNTLVDLKIAEAHFLNKDYIEAAVAYDAFAKSHPDDHRIPDVYYQLGLANMYQILNPDQDQTSTLAALHAFTTMKERFPEDRRMPEVLLYINRCENQLALRDLSVGQFYLRTDYYVASINRIEGLLKKYPNFYERDKAYYYLCKAYLLNGEYDKAVNALNIMVKEHTSSEFTADARELIEGNQ